MNKSTVLSALRFGAWAVLALVGWQLLPDRYVGPYNAWNLHAIMEFVITLFSISLAGKLAVYLLGAHQGLVLMGLIGGFASSTATIHNMGVIAKSQPQLADHAALSGVLSNIATLVQLVVLLQLLAPPLLTLLVQPLCFGFVGISAYAVYVLVRRRSLRTADTPTDEVVSLNWKSLLTLTALVSGVSYVSAALNAAYGQGGLWMGAALSGLVDAHAFIPTVASMLTQQKLSASEALMPLLIALSANTLTKSLIALQSGGWTYARKVSSGVWITTFAVWAGYLMDRS